MELLWAGFQLPSAAAVPWEALDFIEHLLHNLTPSSLRLVVEEPAR